MEPAEKIKNLQHKLSIKRANEKILMDLLNIPEDERNFLALKERIEDLMKEKDRADNLALNQIDLACNMPMTDPKNSFKCYHFENGCKVEFLDKKVHEKSCSYQKVLCPELNCKQLHIANDMMVHLNQDHKILKVKDEWNFEGSKDKLIKIVCLKSFQQKFFPQMYIKDGILYFKVVMFGLQEMVVDFKAWFTFFQGDGNDYNISDSVYPMTKDDNKDGFSIVSLKKLTEYYDFESMEMKHQDNIRFSLKITKTNVKFDEIAKEKQNSQKNAKIVQNNTKSDPKEHKKEKILDESVSISSSTTQIVQKSPQQGEQPDTQGATKTPTIKRPKPKFLPGGLMVEDLEVGKGPVATKGKMIWVYYKGKLKANNKQFASNVPPANNQTFKFRLGVGEVIKGWDIGIEGMQVGGKRRLTVPSKMGHGLKGFKGQGTDPDIPPNAILVFVVDCMAIGLKNNRDISNYDLWKNRYICLKDTYSTNHRLR